LGPWRNLIKSEHDIKSKRLLFAADYHQRLAASRQNQIEMTGKEAINV
jgi:hypothetical protein